MGFWPRFVKGLVTPSIPAVAMASATVMLLGMAAIPVTGPHWFADGGTRWFAIDGEDDELFVTARVLFESDVPAGTVVLLGASGVRETIRSPPALAAAITRERGMATEVLDLTMDGQRISETLALAAEIEPPVTFVVGLNPGRFVYGENDTAVVLDPPRLAIDNPVLRDEMQRWGFSELRSTGWPLIDHPRVYADRIPYVPLNLLLGGREQDGHRYIGQLPTADLSQVDVQWEGRIESMVENAEVNVQALVRMREQVEARGQRLVLYALPMHRTLFGQPGETAYYEAYDARVIPRLREEGFTIIEPDGPFAPEEYADPLHFNNTDSMDRVTEWMARRLAALPLPAPHP